jgi:hypothetical protein
MSRDRDEKKDTRPSHIAYHVREGKERDENYWDRCGVAFEHGDRAGFNVVLSSMPVDGKLTLRELREQQGREPQNRESEAPARSRRERSSRSERER